MHNNCTQKFLCCLIFWAIGSCSTKISNEEKEKLDHEFMTAFWEEHFLWFLCICMFQGINLVYFQLFQDENILLKQDILSGHIKQTT